MNYLWGLKDLLIKFQSLFEGLVDLSSKFANLKANFANWTSSIPRLIDRFLHHSTSTFLKHSMRMQNIPE